MKKTLKSIIILIIIIVILYIINCFRNYFVINKLIEKSQNFELSNNYKLKQTSLSISDDSTTWEVLSEYYCKNNIFLYKNHTALTQGTDKNITSYGVWHNKNSNEHLEFIYDKDNKIIEDNLIDKENLELPPLSTLIFNNFSTLDFFKSITIQDAESYKILTFYKNYKSILSINTNTGLIESINYIYNNSSYNLINSYKENIITDEIIKKPNF